MIPLSVKLDNGAYRNIISAPGMRHAETFNRSSAKLTLVRQIQALIAVGFDVWGVVELQRAQQAGQSDKRRVALGWDDANLARIFGLDGE